MAGPRVVHVINRLERNGGAEVSLAQLLPHLQLLGVQNALVTLYPHQRGSRLDEVRDAGVHVVELNAPSLVGSFLPVLAAVRSARPDLVHATLFDATVAGLPAARSAGIPAALSVVNTVHSEATKAREARPWVRRCLRLAEVSVARWCACGVHALTSFAADSAVRELSVQPRQVRVIPRGRDRSLLGNPSADRRIAARATLGLGADDEVILNVARQEAQKAQHILVEAFAAVATRRPNAVLLIAGREGANSERVAAAVRASGVADRVRMLGARDDVPDLLCASDVFAFPSLWEGLGGSVLEAMAMKVPVVSSDLPPVAEVLAGTGVLVRPGQPAPLADALVDALDHREPAQARAEAAYERFEREYRIEGVARRTAEWYREIVSAHGRRRG